MKFFNDLAEIMDKHKLELHQIFNFDNSVLTVHKTKVVIAPKGQKQVDSITFRESSKLVPLLYAVSASGFVILPVDLAKQNGIILVITLISHITLIIYTGLIGIWAIQEHLKLWSQWISLPQPRLNSHYK